MPGEPVRELLYDDWPSLECPHWLPDKATAFRAPEYANRYVVRLATFGEPASVFEDAIESAKWALPGYVESWSWVESASAYWDDVEQRIVTEWVCAEDDPLPSDMTAELIAQYFDRLMVAEIEGHVWGQTAIIDVFVPDGAPARSQP